MEIHIFINPINPSLELQSQFKQTCSQVEGMKCVNLKLDFVKHGLLSVLMSSRYVRGDMDLVWQECFKDARFLAKEGYEVSRSKIECTASIQGVPKTDEEAISLPKKTYFEFHMVFSRPDGTTPSEEEIEKAKQVAKNLEKR